MASTSPHWGAGVVPSYDAIAEQYAAQYFDELDGKPFERAQADFGTKPVRDGARWAPAMGEGWVNMLSPVVDRARRCPELFESPSSEPLTENQRALPMFWKCPSVLVGRQGLAPWTR